MRVKPEIVDESNDRKYFSIVPNYITNHSSYLEQGVYLTMKRIAGETGVCFASQKELAKRGGISQQTVSRVISKLISRGWIKEDGFQPSKTKPVKRWRIVDLWRLNLDYYDKPKDEIVTLVSESFDAVSPSLNSGGNTNPKIISLSQQPKKIDNQRSEYKIVNVVSKEEETIEEDNTKDNILSNDSIGNKVVWNSYDDPYKVYKWQRVDQHGYVLLSKNNPPIIGNHDVIKRALWIYARTHNLDRVPEGFEINHINHIRTDDSPENLEALTKSDHQKKHWEERRALSKIDILPEKKINELISLFEPLNPSYKEMFKNKTQRAALLRLTTQHGEEKVAQMIKMLPKIIAQPYAPRITSPYQLEMKLGELRIFMAQKKNKGNERRVVNGRGLN